MHNDLFETVAKLAFGIGLSIIALAVMIAFSHLFIL
jgi:hypothetical protein